YVATDIGALSAGFLTSILIARSGAVHRSRMKVYLFFALLALLSIPAAFLDSGVLLIVVLLLLGFAALGVFPNYYSFTQELTTKHKGKITGTLGFIWWAVSFGLHLTVGLQVKARKAQYLESALASGLNKEEATALAGRLAYQPAVALIGVLPLIGFVAMLLLWNLRST